MRHMKSAALRCAHSHVRCFRFIRLRTYYRGVSFNHFNHFFEKASESSKDHQNDHENDRLMMSVAVMGRWILGSIRRLWYARKLGRLIAPGALIFPRLKFYFVSQA
jgi:hypothetical protein